MLVQPLARVASVGESMAQAVVERHFRLHPELYERFGQAAREHCLRDARFHIGYLAESAREESAKIFLTYASWVRTLLQGYDMPVEHLMANIRILHEVIAQQPDLPWGEKAASILDEAMLHLQQNPEGENESFIVESQPLAGLAKEYLNALLNKRRHEALAMVLRAVDEGVAVQDVYLHVFQVAQRETGRLWLSRKASVAQEHYVSAATQFIISQLYPRVFLAERVGRSFVAACVGDELHEIGMRMVADFLEMEGWDTQFLGANLPAAEIVATVAEGGAMAVGLSATMPFHVAEIAAVIRSLRANSATRSVFVIVGGYAFASGGADWRTTGADAWAEDAGSAVDILTAELATHA